MFGNWWFRKEKPLPGLMGLGGGATGLGMHGGVAEPTNPFITARSSILLFVVFLKPPLISFLFPLV